MIAASIVTNFVFQREHQGRQASNSLNRAMLQEQSRIFEPFLQFEILKRM
jgi:hypothetical protein